MQSRGTVANQLVHAITGDNARSPALAVECMPDRQSAGTSLRIELLGAVSAATRVDLRDSARPEIGLAAGELVSLGEGVDACRRRSAQSVGRDALGSASSRYGGVSWPSSV